MLFNAGLSSRIKRSSSISDSLEFFIAAVLICSLCCASAFFTGKDINWDQLNYHLYAGFAASGHRITQDFLPASIQSYLNPYAYVPFSSMVLAGFPDWVIVCLLAAAHSINLIVVYAISMLVFDRASPNRFLLRFSATLLAGLFPVFLQTLGTSFIDSLVSIPILMGVYLLVRAANQTGHVSLVGWSTLSAGALFGIATGLKLTSAVFVPAALVALLVLHRKNIVRALAKALSFGGASVLAFSAVNGYWAYLVYKTYGNPFFPFFNTIFKSQDFPAYAIRNHRFLPDTWWETLIFPFKMLVPDRGVYTEPFAPDVRFAVIVVLSIALVAFGFVNRLRKVDIGIQAVDRGANLEAWVGGLIVAWILWLAGSANGRYMMPLALLAPIPLFWLLARLVRRQSFLMLSCALILAVQVAGCVIAMNPRWGPSQWTGSWFEIEMPEELIVRPNLILSIESQSLSFLAPFVHRESAFVNVSGQQVLDKETNGFGRLEGLLSKYPNDTFLVYQVKIIDENNLPLIVGFGGFEQVAKRLGLDVDRSRCGFIRFGGGFPLFKYLGWTGDEPTVRPTRPGSYAVYCAARQSSEAAGTYYEDKAKAEKVFSRLETLCPSKFNPPQTTSHKRGDNWGKQYVNSDFLVVVGSQDVWYQFFGEGERIRIGSLEHVLSPALAAKDCAKKAFEWDWSR
jgi:Glycosyltransferase family 87